MLDGETLHAPCVLEVHRERLLDHHVNAARGHRLDDVQMLADAAERGDRHRIDGFQHRLHRRIDDVHAETVPIGIAACEIGVVFDDRHNLDVATVLAAQ